MKTVKILVNLALVGVLVWFLVSHEQKIRASASRRDSMAYWAAGNLLLHRQNPYAVESVLALERSQGYEPRKPLVLRTPPWSVWMVLPLGLLNAYWAWVAWLAILLTALVIAMRISWRMYGNGPRPPNAFLLAGYLFAPVAACLVAAQLGIVLLLGVVLFLSLEEEHPFLAGAALLIPFAKPHIFMLLWPILAVWIFTRKRWSLLGGLAAAFLITNSIAVAFDPAIFQHYRGMLQQQAIQYEFIPALSGMLRLLFFRRFFWAQFLPAAVGLLWSFWYYWRNQHTWNWRQHGPALLVVSILTTPYSWITDEVVLLPAILQGALWLNQAKLKVRSQLVILLLVCLDLIMLLILKAQVPPSTGIYFWSSLVWFAWYFYARSKSRNSSPVVGEGLPSLVGKTEEKAERVRVHKTLHFIVRIALLALIVWFLAAHEQKIRANVGGRDSTLYWATAKMLIHGGNPYSVPDILALEQLQGYATGKPKMYRPPPWSTWMLLPLGMLSPYWAWVAWMAIAVTSLVIAIRVSWRIYGDGLTPPPIFLLAAYLFAPVVACLVMAQMGTVLLLGIVLFFLLAEERPFVAGAVLLLPLAKPHFFALLWPILLVWAITRRKWLLLWGIGSAFLWANAVAVAFDPAIFQHYREMLRLDRMQNEFMPNLSGIVRALFFRRFFWFQFVPVGLGMLWSARYYWNNRHEWDWSQHGPLLLVVAAIIAPYSWMTDEVALLPAVLQGVLWLRGAELKLRSQFVILLFVGLNMLLLLIVRAKVDSFTGIYFWSSLVWFSWYWYARGFAPQSDSVMKIKS